MLSIRPSSPPVQCAMLLRRRRAALHCVRLALKAALVVSASIAATGLMLAVVSSMIGAGVDVGDDGAGAPRDIWFDAMSAPHETTTAVGRRDATTTVAAPATTVRLPGAAAVAVASAAPTRTEPSASTAARRDGTVGTAAGRVLNPHPFRLVHSPDGACKGRRSDLFILAIVHSAPGNLKRRLVVRETWGSPEHYDRVKTVVLFALGARRNDTAVMKSVAAESAHYGDIIQEDFEDSYKNLTYKGIMWLGWASKHCMQARYVLKVDDDIFVNIFNLAAHLSAIYKRPAAVTGGSRSRTVLCLLWTRMPVQRDPKNKWYVSKDDWADDYFTRYCSGSAYILTRDLVPGMHANSFNTKFFWVDDFYVTGLLVRPLNASYVSLSSLYVLKKAEMHERLVDGYAIFGHIPGSMNSRYSLWKEVLTARGLLPAHV